MYVLVSDVLESFGLISSEVSEGVASASVDGLATGLMFELKDLSLRLILTFVSCLMFLHFRLIHWYALAIRNLVISSLSHSRP